MIKRVKTKRVKGKYIPYCIDLTQSGDELKVPEIRVWCHPHYVKKSGDDYYRVFESFMDAFKFIKTHKEAEDVPLVAISGIEINLFDIK